MGMFMGMNLKIEAAGLEGIVHMQTNAVIC
jgi:hypothetical protein